MGYSQLTRGSVVVSSMRIATGHDRLNYFLGGSLAKPFSGILALNQQYHSSVDLPGRDQISERLPFFTIHRHVLVSSPVLFSKTSLIGPLCGS
jgi:hypothetical protein